jgi:hypothetical protein
MLLQLRVGDVDEWVQDEEGGRLQQLRISKYEQFATIKQIHPYPPDRLPHTIM